MTLDDLELENLFSKFRRQYLTNSILHSRAYLCICKAFLLKKSYLASVYQEVGRGERQSSLLKILSADTL